MKKILLTFLTVFSLTMQSQAFGTEIASIKNRSNGQEIIYSHDGEKAEFHLKDGETKTLLNSLEVKVTGHELDPYPDFRYSFNITKGLVSATGKAYYWCWSLDASLNGDMGPNAILGLYAFFAGVAGSVALCAVGPAVPAAIGVALAPLDSMLTLGLYLFKRDEVAARKFNKLISGQSTQTGDKVFDLIKSEISEM